MMEWGDWDVVEVEGNGGVVGVGGGVDARERHKLAERERRKSMRQLFLSLHSLLPHAHTVPKEQSAILDEIIKYIPLAAARLRALQTRRDTVPLRTCTAKHRSPRAVYVSLRNNSSSSSSSPSSPDCDIRVAPEPSSAVSIRLRGDRVNVSVTGAKGGSHSFLLSTLLDELEAHHLDLIRTTHCRDGSRLIHHTESKIRDVYDQSPVLLKTKLQELACKLHELRESSRKRSFQELD